MISDNISKVNPNNCFGCSACEYSCPCNAITMEFESGFLHPIVNEDKCVRCGLCISQCQAVKPLQNVFPLSRAFVLTAKNEQVYSSASSGGFFGVLAKYFIEEMDGVVCGAVMDDDLYVRHRIVSDTKDIYKVQGSKYVQSDISRVYSSIKDYLDDGRPVLFSGTPCQVSAVRGLFGNKYDTIFFVDLICHGCPSPEMLRKYLLQLAKGRKVDSVLFRTKDKYERYGFNLRVSFKDNSRPVFIAGNEDPYYRLFHGNLSFRESCYQCPFAQSSRVGDITIGDCGNSAFYTDFHPDKTLSTIYPITEKGYRLFEKIVDGFFIKEADVRFEASANKQLNNPSIRPEGRGIVYENPEVPIVDLANELLGKVSLLTVVKNRLKRILPESTRHRLFKAITR